MEVYRYHSGVETINLLLMSKDNSNGEIRRRIVDATLREFYKKHAPLPEHTVIARAKMISSTVNGTCLDVLKADKGNPYDESAMRGLVEKLYLEHFNTMSRDELLFLVTVMHSEVAMEGINERVRQGLEGGQSADDL